MEDEAALQSALMDEEGVRGEARPGEGGAFVVSISREGLTYVHKWSVLTRLVWSQSDFLFFFIVQMCFHVSPVFICSYILLCCVFS